MGNFNFNSPKDVSILFFGGKQIITVKEPFVNELGVHEVYKSGINKGEYKYRNVDKEIEIKGFGLNPHKDWLTKREGTYSTNDKILKLIAKRRDTEAGKVAELMLEIRTLQKLLSTYYKGYEEFIHNDNLIHGHLSHCGYETDDRIGGGTGTGRLSSVKPNLQNIPRSED